MTSKASDDKIELQMTPMIDIVFQLLIFFILTFKIVAVEGDFNVKMPLGVSSGMPDTPLPPLKVRLQSNPEGQLSGLSLDNRQIEFGTDGGFGQLRRQVMGVIRPSGQPSAMSEAEVELDCDYQLQYRWVIEAITAVTGYVDEEKQVQKLVEKVKFAAPRKAPAAGG